MLKPGVTNSTSRCRTRYLLLRVVSSTRRIVRYVMVPISGERTLDRPICPLSISQGIMEMAHSLLPPSTAYVRTIGVSVIWPLFPACYKRTPIPGLLQEDMDRIIAFVRETQRIEGFEPYPPG
jgi:hypothetical protein